MWPGTVVASSALAVLAWGYGLYLRFVGSDSVAGAASAILVGLVFIYYVARIPLFGAEIIGVSSEPPAQHDRPRTHRFGIAPGRLRARLQGPPSSKLFPVGHVGPSGKTEPITTVASRSGVAAPTTSCWRCVEPA